MRVGVDGGLSARVYCLLAGPGSLAGSVETVKTLLGAGLSVGLTVAVIGATHTPDAVATTEVRLSAVSAPLPVTVLTLEGGLAGLQNLVPFTQLQLRGDLCDPPDTCQAVDYPAWPLGQYFNDLGAVRVNEAIAALRDDGTPITLFGHSQGGQVIYSALRGWAADPSHRAGFRPGVVGVHRQPGECLRWSRPRPHPGRLALPGHGGDPPVRRVGRLAHR